MLLRLTLTCPPLSWSGIGSCNDVLEVEIKPNEYVQLQRGPKSYSYGPFVKALELCRSTVGDAEAGDDHHATMQKEFPPSRDSHEEEEPDDGGLEDFLNSCENEMDDTADGDDEESDEEEDGFDDYLYNNSMNSNSDQAAKSSQTSIEADITAIDAFKDVLHSVRAGLVENSLAQLLDCPSQSNDNERSNMNAKQTSMTIEDQYCSILLRSELQTIDFYLVAACELRQQLSNCLDSSEEQESFEKDDQAKNFDDYHFDNKETTHEQINSLASAYISIRYPHLISG